MTPEYFERHQPPWPQWLVERYLDWVVEDTRRGVREAMQEETRDSLAEFSGQTLGIDEEYRAQRMIECEDWEEN